MARQSEREERSFKYQKRPVEAIRERANARGGGFDSIIKSKYKTYKVKDGKNLIRILPQDNGKVHYGYDLWVNYGIGVDNQSYLSLSKMKDEKDPLAEARRDAERAGDKDLVKALNPRQRILMWVIDRTNEDEGPLLFAAPITVDKAIAALSFDEDTKEVIYVDDPNEGADIRFYKEGTGLKTDYPAEKMRILKTSPLHDDEGQSGEWLDFVNANPLAECVQFYDYDHIAMMYDGTARVEKADDTDDDTPKPSARSRQGAETKHSRESDDTEETVQPATRSRASKVDEDDEPVERPRRGRINGSDEDDEPEIKPRRAKMQVDDDDDVPVKPRASIRDRLQRRSRLEETED